MYLKLLRFILVFFGIISASNCNREGFKKVIQEIEKESAEIPTNITGSH